MKKQILFVLLAAAWLGALSVVYAKMQQYDSTPAQSTAAARMWPKKVKIQPVAEAPTLVMLAHPQCPCTRATLTELQEIIELTQGKMAIKVLFFKPATEAAGWERTALWTRAQKMLGVQNVVDVDGKIAERFGLHTSGEVALYNKEAQLVFQGGITLGRGHVGNNAGRESVVRAVKLGSTSVSRTPVFGCVVLAQEKKPASKGTES